MITVTEAVFGLDRLIVVPVHGTAGVAHGMGILAEDEAFSGSRREIPRSRESYRKNKKIIRYITLQKRGYT